MKRLLLTAMTLLFAFPAAGAVDEARCLQGIDNSLKVRRLMDRIPVANQGRQGLCYAYAATQMIDGLRLQMDLANGGVGGIPPSSSVANALMFGEQRERLDIEGGNGCRIANFLLQEGTCSSSTLRERSVDGKVHISRLLTAIEKLHESHDDAAPGPGKPSSGEAASMIRTWLLTYGIPGAEFLSETEIRDHLISDNEVQFLRWILVKESCSLPAGRSLLAGAGVRCTNHDLRRVTDEMAELRLLEMTDRSMGLPIGIHYCGRVLLEESSYDGLIDPPAGTPAKKAAPGCDSHVSLLIDRRWNAERKKCQILVRNSWGRRCNGYGADWNCESGNIWVDADALARNTTSAFLLH